MKITRHQLRRIIGEALLEEQRAPQLSLLLRDEPYIEVGETGDEFYPSNYGSSDEMIAAMELELGARIPVSAIVEDGDFLGMGDVPLSQVWAFVAAGPEEDY